MPGWLNGNVAARILAAVGTAAIIFSLGYVSTRASQGDLEALEKKHNADMIASSAAVATQQKETNRRLRCSESNLIKVCQYLSRLDRQSGGSGLDCHEPE